MAYIYIEDTGIGMDKETQQRISLPYEQCKPSITIPEGGFGLGLSICKQLVKLQGGEIHVTLVPNEGKSV